MVGGASARSHAHAHTPARPQALPLSSLTPANASAAAAGDTGGDWLLALPSAGTWPPPPFAVALSAQVGTLLVCLRISLLSPRS